MTERLSKSPRAVIASVAAALFLAGATSPLAAQSSQPVTVPADAKAPIRLSSRVTQNWYESGKVHVFLMIDGFTVEQGTWTLRARDGVVWFDEGDVGPDGLKRLGVYAEGKPTVSVGGSQEAVKGESIYLTVTTTGDIERPAAGDRAKPAESEPLYLRAKKVREETPGAGDRTGQPAETPPEGEPAPGPAAAPEREASAEITVEPLDDIRKVKVESKVEGTKRVTIWTGGVLVTRGDLEMRADDVVIWTNEGEARKKYGDAAEAYLEGNVVINQAYRTIRASRVFYDFDRKQALIVDASIRSFSRARDVPVYYYAERVRQLAEGKFVATNATFTTSEMGHPHTAIHGSEFQIVDLSGRDPETGERMRRGRFDATHVISTIRGVPVSYWPRMAGDVEEAETALRRVNLTHQESRGAGVESQWYLWRLLGIGEEPEGFKKTYLNMNFYGERGPYVGLESKYQREKFYGELLSNFIYDYGEDRIGGDDLEAPRHERGRATWRHRQFFWDDWQATIEASYLSDRHYLREWYEEEDKQGKDQETLVHLKKQWDRQAVTGLVKKRINDFQTQTETYPRLEHHLIGQPLLADRLSYFTTTTYELARYDPDEDFPFDRLRPENRGSPVTNIADTRHEVDYPLQAGFVKVVPFADGRLSYFEERLGRRGADDRAWGAAGARASWYLSRVFDNVQSDLWGLNRLRHMNTFDVEVMRADTTLNSIDLYPFDEPGSAETKLVRGIDDTDIVRLGWRQRLQTKRGPERRTVDWVMFDLLMTFFGNKERPLVSPDDDRVRNNLQANYSWQLSDTTSVVGDTYYATDEGRVRLSNVGLSVIRSPRFSYYIGSRYVRGADSAVGTFGMDYVINRKWRFHFFEQYDFNMSKTNSSTRLEFIRRLDTWDMKISIELDPGEDDQIFFLQFQPVGVPEFRIGY